MEQGSNTQLQRCHLKHQHLQARLAEYLLQTNAGDGMQRPFGVLWLLLVQANREGWGLEVYALGPADLQRAVVWGPLSHCICAKGVVLCIPKE